MWGGCCEGTHWKWQTGGPIELRDGHFEVTEVVELTQRQRAEWDDSKWDTQRIEGRWDTRKGSPGRESQLNRKLIRGEREIQKVWKSKGETAILRFSDRPWSYHQTRFHYFVPSDVQMHRIYLSFFSLWVFINIYRTNRINCYQYTSFNFTLQDH